MLVIIRSDKQNWLSAECESNQLFSRVIITDNFGRHEVLKQICCKSYNFGNERKSKQPLYLVVKKISKSLLCKEVFEELLLLK